MPKFPQVNLQFTNAAAELTRALIRPGHIGALNSPGIGLPSTSVGWMDYKAWRDHVARWDIRGPIPIKLEVHSNSHLVYVRIQSSTRDSRDPDPYNPRTLDLSVDVLVPTMTPNEETDNWLRALVRWLLCHELDEFLMIDGERKYDPHAAGLPAPTPENS